MAKVRIAIRENIADSFISEAWCCSVRVLCIRDQHLTSRPATYKFSMILDEALYHSDAGKAIRSTLEHSQVCDRRVVVFNFCGRSLSRIACSYSHCQTCLPCGR